MSIGSAGSVAKDGYYKPSFSMLAGSLLLQAGPQILALVKPTAQIIHPSLTGACVEVH